MSPIEFDHSLLGQPIVIGRNTVRPEQIVDYLIASGEEEAFTAAPEAPPLFGIAFLGEVPPIGLQFGSRSFMAAQAYWPLQPIRAGDELTTTTVLREVYEKTGRSGHLVFVVWETELTNGRGEPVARCRRTMVHQA
ncbi:MAG: hypothetical protein KatS3mg061_1736 [Dehalococcoidia bacterium]|nr:MAG: hypothetical protein KatS3mg061_1736 [Dehalococcoidia bacterium]